MSNSLPSINPQTIDKIRITLNSWGEDAQLLAKMVESMMKILQGTGYGKVTVYMQNNRVTMIRSEETHAFDKTQEWKVDNS